MVKRIEIKTGTQEELQAALAAKEQQVIAAPPPRALGQLAPDEQVGGADALTGEDLKIPHLILVQAQHREIPENEKHCGDLYNDLTGEFRQTVSAVLLNAGKGRACFDRTFSYDSEPLCASDDAVMPRADYVGKTVTDTLLGFSHVINGDGCAVCPLSKFAANGTKPLCGKSYPYAMLDLETGLPFVLRAQRTAISAARQLNTIAKTLGRRKIITISSRKVTSDQGTYYVPVFTISAASPDVTQQAALAAQEWGSAAMRAKALPSGEPSFPDDPAEQEMPF